MALALEFSLLLQSEGQAVYSRILDSEWVSQPDTPSRRAMNIFYLSDKVTHLSQRLTLAMTSWPRELTHFKLSISELI